MFGFGLNSASFQRRCSVTINKTLFFLLFIARDLWFTWQHLNATHNWGKQAVTVVTATAWYNLSASAFKWLKLCQSCFRFGYKNRMTVRYRWVWSLLSPSQLDADRNQWPELHSTDGNTVHAVPQRAKALQGFVSCRIKLQLLSGIEPSLNQQTNLCPEVLLSYWLKAKISQKCSLWNTDSSLTSHNTVLNVL